MILCLLIYLQVDQLSFLQKVSQIYSTRHKKHTLQTAVKKETSGDFKKVLLALMKTRYEYYADRLFHAMWGIGTDDRALVYIFSILTKAELRIVSQIFHARRKKGLESYIKGDTSGDYEKLLRELLH